MAVANLEKDAVRLVPDILNMMEERDGIPIYTITDWAFQYSNESNPNAGIVVEIRLKRRILSEMMTTFFPTILLVAITAATTHSWKKLQVPGKPETKFLEEDKIEFQTWQIISYISKVFFV